MDLTAEPSIGEKRAVENGEDCELEVPLSKKVKIDEVLSGDMKKVAEIVLVLAAMGKIRAGRSPTVAETEMMVEAREKLVDLCKGFAPKDVFPRDAFGTVIEDLGLSKLREQKLGFRSPKMSIAEKLLLTKRKMEKSEEFSLHSAPYTSQQSQTKLAAAAENHGTSHAVRMFPSDKPNHAPTSSGGFHPASPLAHVSSSNSTSLPYQLPTSEVRPMVSSGISSSHLRKDSSSLSMPRFERPHFRLDGSSNGASYTSQVQANSSVEHTMVKTPTWSMQPPSSLSAKFGSENKVPTHTSVKVEGSADTSKPRMASQATSKSLVAQTTSVNPPNTHQHSQGMQQAPSLVNSHNEIGKIVQKLLQPHIPEHPTWTPPSRDYMNKALTCQTCKFAINEVDNVLVCDACEKGYHLKCLQFNNQKAIPRGEWHCGKCLALSSGKPLPPKYGRVMRNIAAPKVSSNATAVQSSSEQKVGTLDEKVNQQRITANGNSGLQNSATGTMGNNNGHSPSGLMMPDERDIQFNDIVSNREKMDDKPPGTSPINLTKSSGSFRVSPSADLSVERSSEEKLVTESKSQPPAKSDTVINLFDHSQTHGNSLDNDQTRLRSRPDNDQTISAEIPSKQCHDTKLMVKDAEKSFNGETIGCNPNDEVKQDEQGVAQANHVETSGPSVGTSEEARSLSTSLHDVEWIGDILQLVGEKEYYQSCCINGVVYKVQDHALLYFKNKVMPSKLQAMWEDSKTKLKWVIVNRCYFPADLPETVGRPCSPESNEVYESNHESTVMAGLIQGSCKVLSPSKFTEKCEKRTHSAMETTDELRPLFLCKWFYDELKGLFRDVSSCGSDLL